MWPCVLAERQRGDGGYWGGGELGVQEHGLPVGSSETPGTLMPQGVGVFTALESGVWPFAGVWPWLKTSCVVKTRV